MFLIYQNIIKSISSIFAFLIFTISFFLLQLSISFINITPIEFLIKPFLVNKIDGYDNSFSEAVLYIDTDSKKTIAKIKIDLTNKVKSEQFQLFSEFETNLVDIINFDYNYSFSSSLILFIKAVSTSCVKFEKFKMLVPSNFSFSKSCN